MRVGDNKCRKLLVTTSDHHQRQAKNRVLFREGQGMREYLLELDTPYGRLCIELLLKSQMPLTTNRNAQEAGFGLLFIGQTHTDSHDVFGSVGLDTDNDKQPYNI